MEFRIDRDRLAAAVSWAARVLPTRPASPVLAGVLIYAGERLGLHGFDYEASARAEVDAEIAATGRAVVSGKLLAEIARGLPDDVVHVTADGGGRLRLTCGGYRFVLPVMPAGEYPLLPDLPPAVGTLGTGAFATAVTQVAMATSRDETVPMLTGVWLEIDDGRLTLAGTDRYRMAVRELEWTSGGASPAAALVPARPLAEAVKQLPVGPHEPTGDPHERTGDPHELTGDASLTVGLTEGSLLGLEAAGRRAAIRLLDERFVNFRAHFPGEFAATAEVPATELAEAIKRVAVVADRNAPIWLDFRDDHLALETGTGEDASAGGGLDAKLSGDGMRVAFNPRFLLDGLAAIEPDMAVFGLTAPEKPVVISGSGLRYLVQPIRRAVRP